MSARYANMNRGDNSESPNMLKEVVYDTVYGAGQSMALDAVLGGQGLMNPYVNKHVANALLYQGVKRFVSPMALPYVPDAVASYAPEIIQGVGFVAADYALNRRVNVMGALNNSLQGFLEPRAMSFLRLN